MNIFQLVVVREAFRVADVIKTDGIASFPAPMRRNAMLCLPAARRIADGEGLAEPAEGLRAVSRAIQDLAAQGVSAAAPPDRRYTAARASRAAGYYS